MVEPPKTTSPWLDSLPDKRRYPQLEKQIETDVIIVGGGITGVMTSWHLAQEGLSVVLLEKNRIASGDTAFTTGFLLRVPDTSISKLVKDYGEDFVKMLFEGAGNAQDTIRNLVKNEKIDCGFSDCSAYYCSYTPGDSLLKEEWEAIAKTDKRSEFVNGKEVSKLGIDIAEAIKFNNEAQFNPRKFIFGLLALPSAKNIKIFEDSEVIGIDISDNIVAKTAHGSVTAKRIVVTSGYPIESFKELREVFEPKITYALAARYEKKVLLSPDLFWDTFDPYFYYRCLDEKTIILGGADRRVGEKLPSGESPHEKLKTFLKQHFKGKFTVTNNWSGTLYDSPDGLPFASEHPHYKGKVFVGNSCGFGGNGLVLGTFAGMVLADVVAGKPNKYASLLSFTRTNISIPKPETKKEKIEGKKSRIFIKVAGINEVDEGTPFCAEAKGKKIAIFKTSDGVYAIDNTCTHAGGQLSDGIVDGCIIQCPLHGARFNFQTGAVVGPPATKPVESYKTRVSGDSIEVEVETTGDEGIAAQEEVQKPQGPKLFENARKNIGYVIKVSLLAVLFWLIQFFYMFYWAVPGQLVRSIILASSYSGATLIGLALVLGPIAMLFPKYNYVEHRRSFGVWGFTFIISHVIWVIIYYQFTVQSFLSNLNPFSNAIIFGALAFVCYIPMYLTSTDWAISKLGIKNWKTIHRIVYIAFLISTLHFIRITYLNNTTLLWNYSKVLLMAVAALAYAFELAAYFKFMGKKRTIGNTLYGGILIVLGIILLYLAFLA